MIETNHSDIINHSRNVGATDYYSRPTILITLENNVKEEQIIISVMLYLYVQRYIVSTILSCVAVLERRKDGCSEQRVTRDVDGHLWKGRMGMGLSENSKKHPDRKG